MQDVEVKKKLLITASTFPRYSGDTEPRFILDLAKELQQYYDVTVLAPATQEAAEREMLEGICVERYHYFPLHKWESLCYPGAIVPRIREKKARIILVPFLFVALYHAVRRRREKFDYVHANWFIPQGIVQSFVHMPYIVTGHGGDVTSLNGGLMKGLKRRTVRKAAAVTVVSNALKKEILSWFSAEESEKMDQKIQIQPLGCNTSQFSPNYRVENLWSQGKEKIILFVGRLVEKKGVRYLIEAMQWVRGRLIIVGDGPLQCELMRLTETMRLQDRIYFLGAKTHEELPEIFASADVFVAPSVTAKDKDKEGFGLVILEAMASGLPVVASRSGGITEIIHHGENGLLAEERDSQGLARYITQMLYNKPVREKCIKQMQSTVEQYDYHNVGIRYRDIIEESLTVAEEG